MSGPDFIDGPIWTHQKRSGDVIFAGVREHHGYRNMDIRLWVNGGTIATAKGGVIPLDAVASLARALAAWAAENAPDGPENGS